MSSTFDWSLRKWRGSKVWASGEEGSLWRYPVTFRTRSFFGLSHLAEKRRNAARKLAAGIGEDRRLRVLRIKFDVPTRRAEHGREVRAKLRHESLTNRLLARRDQCVDPAPRLFSSNPRLLRIPIVRKTKISPTERKIHIRGKSLDHVVRLR